MRQSWSPKAIPELVLSYHDQITVFNHSFCPFTDPWGFVNLGLVVGCDQTGEWLIDVVSSRQRATKLDDENVFPLVAAELQRLQTKVENYSEPDLYGSEVELSEDWLRQLSRDSQGVLQFSPPKGVLGETPGDALQKLWQNLIVEHIASARSNISKSTVIAQYWAALKEKKLTAKNLKRKARLETTKTHTPIDVVVHNGVAKDIAQCWSLQVKDADDLLNDIKAWAWTIRNLRELGGQITTEHGLIEVPNNVRVGVIIAPGEDQALQAEARDVLDDKELSAVTVELPNVGDYAAQAVASLHP